MCVQGEESGAEAEVLWRTGADCDLSRHPSSHLHNLWFFHQKIQDPVAGGSRDSEIFHLNNLSALADGVKCRAVVQEEHPDRSSATVAGCGEGLMPLHRPLIGWDGPQTGGGNNVWDHVVDVDQFFQALHGNRCDCYWPVCLLT